MKNSLFSRVHVRGVVAADGGEDIVAAVQAFGSVTSQEV